jgi:hypothetical protein
MSATVPPLRSPIPEVYVLWHPDCPIGEILARRIYEWLRPGNGRGPEVFYRSPPAPGAPARGLPPPLPGESRPGALGSSGKVGRSNLQIVIPLIDENMVADAAWRFWLGELGKNVNPSLQRKLMPVALDATAYNMSSPLRELNYLRPGGLPLAPRDVAGGPALDAVVRTLRKQLTEAMCRILLMPPRATSPTANQPDTDEVLPKVTIFLSHAKADGTAPATRLRDYIYSQTQLAAFYDENDIAFGSLFSREIQRDLVAHETAALIAVRTAQYASRPWCRRELSLFRRPRLEHSSPDGLEQWSLSPSLVVEAMEAAASSPGIPEFGNSPVVRWSDQTLGLEEVIVMSVIRDAMLASFHASVGASLSLPRSAATPKIVINWLPDPTTLLHIPSLRGPVNVDVVHPGRGLSGMELDTLGELFPNVTFHSFEEVS